MASKKLPKHKLLETWVRDSANMRSFTFMLFKRRISLGIVVHTHSHSYLGG